MDPITKMGYSTYHGAWCQSMGKILSNIHELPPPPLPTYAATTKAWLESVRLCGELVVGTRVLYYGVPFWRDAITVNVGHKMGPNLRLHFLRIVMLQQ